MIYVYAFIMGGLICTIAQFIMDKFKLLPIYVTCLFVVIGAFLNICGVYSKLIEIFGFGASLPISSFGYSLTSSAIKKAEEIGYLGILTGMFDSTSPGIVVAILCSALMALIFKPKG